MFSGIFPECGGSPARALVVEGVPPVGPAHGWGGDPLFEKNGGGGRGITPLPPRSANGSFPAWLKPLFRVKSPAGKVEGVRGRAGYEEGG